MLTPPVTGALGVIGVSGMTSLTDKDFIQEGNITNEIVVKVIEFFY